MGLGRKFVGEFRRKRISRHRLIHTNNSIP
jgi:hypothetical protein